MTHAETFLCGCQKSTLCVYFSDAFNLRYGVGILRLADGLHCPETDVFLPPDEGRDPGKQTLLLGRLLGKNTSGKRLSPRLRCLKSVLHCVSNFQN